MSENLTLRVHDRRDLRRSLNRVALDHDDIWDADQCDVGEAIVRLAVDNPNLLKVKLAELNGRGSSDE